MSQQQHSSESQNTSPMFLRSMQRKQLTHSDREFVINQGFLEQSNQQQQKITQRVSKHEPTSDTVLIELASIPQDLQTTEKSKNLRQELTIGFFVFFLILVILVFLAFSFQNSAENEL